MEGVVGGESEVVSSWVGCDLSLGWELRMLSPLLGDCGGGTSEGGPEEGVVDGIPGSIKGF